MRNYLSFGGGVNSIALHLLLLDQGVEFESVFVHHGTDCPETYDYVAGFQWWLKLNGHWPITVLRPVYGGHSNLYDYCYSLKIVPVIRPRWCTSNFKIKALEKYYKPPAFDMIGIDAGEAHRAKIRTENGIEARYPLIEQGIDRDGCIDIIQSHDLPVPPKSGCFICPYQRVGQWKQLREQHPDLFCSAVKLEERNAEYRRSIGKKPMTISPRKVLLTSLVDEKQARLWPEDEYPPCQCTL
jgi:hypothetical protein